MVHDPIPRWLGLAAAVLVAAACAPALKVKPIDLEADPTAQVQSLKDALEAARQEDVNLLSPTWFARADASAAEAARLRSRGGEIEAILEAVARGRAQLDQARRFAGIARAELREPYQARKDAIAAGAAELYGEEYGSADRDFRALAVSVEEENLSRARRAGEEVTQAFRRLELRAIKEHTLGEARRLIAAARGDGAARRAPRTLKAAESSLAATDRFITGNPKATREIQAKAAETLRQARHLSLVLQQVKAWEPRSGEDRVLAAEGTLDKIEAVLAKGEAPLPPRSLDQRADDLAQRSRVLVDNRAFLGAELSRVQAELARTQAEAQQREAEYQSKLARTTTEEQRAAAQLRAEKEAAARFERVGKMFPPDEADVYRQGNDVLIRLKGLNFEVGKSYVLPEHYPLLTLVMQAARVLEANRIVIEGHTDSTGSESANQVLSQDRAEAVKAYIVNNGDLGGVQVAAAGFGPEKPIAPNTTPEGRRLNRRIDVILASR